MVAPEKDVTDEILDDGLHSESDSLSHQLEHFVLLSHQIDLTTQKNRTKQRPAALNAFALFFPVISCRSNVLSYKKKEKKRGGEEFFSSFGWFVFLPSGKAISSLKIAKPGFQVRDWSEIKQEKRNLKNEIYR